MFATKYKQESPKNNRFDQAELSCSGFVRVGDSLLSHGVDPFDALSLVPLATLDLAAAIVVGAEAVLLSILPTTVVLTVVWPGKDAMALLLIVDVHAFVLSAVTPREDTKAVHFVVLPLAVILAAV